MVSSKIALNVSVFFWINLSRVVEEMKKKEVRVERYLPNFSNVSYTCERRVLQSGSSGGLADCSSTGGTFRNFSATDVF